MSLDSIRPWRSVHRRITQSVAIGNVDVGGNNPIVVYATLSRSIVDISAVQDKIIECVDIGADVMCVDCDTMDDVQALQQITDVTPVPIIAHIPDGDTHMAITALENGADSVQISLDQMSLDIGQTISNLVSTATALNRSLIITFNVEATVSADTVIQDMLHTVETFEKQGFYNIILSVHTDDILLLYTIYMDFAFTCQIPIHLRLKSHGTMIEGSIRGAMVLGNLLWAGIGDIVHIALNADPTEEIKTAYSILKSLGLRHRGVNVISCPSCARQAFDVVKTVTMLEQRLEHISTPLTLSVLGCIVNGIGEAQHTDIGFIGGGKNTHQVYMNGLPSHRLQDEDLIQHIVGLVEQKAHEIESQNLANIP